MLGVDDEYLAFCLDQAIGSLGSGITQQLNTVGDDRKTQQRNLKLQRKIEQRLSILLNLPESASEKRYRTPVVG